MNIEHWVKRIGANIMSIFAMYCITGLININRYDLFSDANPLKQSNRPLDSPELPSVDILPAWFYSYCGFGRIRLLWQSGF